VHLIGVSGQETKTAIAVSQRNRRLWLIRAVVGCGRALPARGACPIEHRRKRHRQRCRRHRRPDQRGVASSRGTALRTLCSNVERCFSAETFGRQSSKVGLGLAPGYRAACPHQITELMHDPHRSLTYRAAVEPVGSTASFLALEAPAIAVVNAQSWDSEIARSLYLALILFCTVRHSVPTIECVRRYIRRHITDTFAKK
jgi:hypothetical protein